MPLRKKAKRPIDSPRPDADELPTVHRRLPDGRGTYGIFPGLGLVGHKRLFIKGSLGPVLVSARGGCTTGLEGNAGKGLLVCMEF